MAYRKNNYREEMHIKIFSALRFLRSVYFPKHFIIRKKKKRKEGIRCGQRWGTLPSSGGSSTYTENGNTLGLPGRTNVKGTKEAKQSLCGCFCRPLSPLAVHGKFMNTYSQFDWILSRVAILRHPLFYIHFYIHIIEMNYPSDMQTGNLTFYD